jgi:hypothetical protein
MPQSNLIETKELRRLENIKKIILSLTVFPLLQTNYAYSKDLLLYGVQAAKSFGGALIVAKTHQNPSAMSMELLEADIPLQAFLTIIGHLVLVPSILLTRRKPCQLPLGSKRPALIF